VRNAEDGTHRRLDLPGKWTPAGRVRCRGAEPQEGSLRAFKARRRRSQGHTLEGRPSLWEQPGPRPRTVSRVEHLEAGGTAGREPRTRTRLDEGCGSSGRQGKPKKGGASPATAVRSLRHFISLGGDHQAQPRYPCPLTPKGDEEPLVGELVDAPLPRKSSSEFSERPY
jgi:hypothetical protein